MCSQPASWRSDTEPIGKSLDNEDINSCPSAKLPLKVTGLAALPGEKHQVKDAELQVRGEGAGDWESGHLGAVFSGRNLRRLS